MACSPSLRVFPSGVWSPCVAGLDCLLLLKAEFPAESGDESSGKIEKDGTGAGVAATRGPQNPEATMNSPRGETPAIQLAAHAEPVLEATRLAWTWHGHQTRKGRTTSYMSHLTAVQGIVIQAGGGPEEVMAALLHDALEDAPDVGERRHREQEISQKFGTAVLRIVLDCTDTTPEEAAETKGPWRQRKERYLAQLRAAAEPSRLVAACDKRHNLGDLVSDLRHEGPATLDRFNAGADEQVWYFTSMTEVVRTAVPGWLARELDELVGELRRLVG
jgi:(p)ppGpp synthase/HD superfamily hydrolase